MKPLVVFTGILLSTVFYASSYADDSTNSTPHQLWRVQTDIPVNARPVDMRISGYLSSIAIDHKVIEMQMSLLQRDEQLERRQSNIIKHAKRPEGYIPTKGRRLSILDTISGAQSDLRKVHELLESTEAKQIPGKKLTEFICQASEEESYLTQLTKRNSWMKGNIKDAEGEHGKHNP